MKRLLSVLLVFLLLASFAVVPTEAQAASSKASESRNGVVRILTIYYAEDMWATGSGLSVGMEGNPSDVFVTNMHVVEGADEVYVLLDNEWDLSVSAFGGTDDGIHAVKCEILSAGPEDFAIIRAERVVDERVSLPLMLSHEANPGDQIYALGYPAVSDSVTRTTTADIDSMTVTSGTISRFIYYEAQQANAIQIDADINHGNSGGPLITEEGYVIGLNAWGSGNEDGFVNLAMEIDYVVARLDQLIENGTLSGFEYTLLTQRPDPEGETTEADQEEENREEEDREEEDREEEKTSNILLWVAIGVGVLALISVFVLKASIDKLRRQRTISRRVTPESATIAQAAVAAEPEPAPEAASEPQAECGVTIMETVTDQPDIPSVPESTPTPAAAFALVGLKGKFAGQRFPVAREIRVGRNPASDLVYPGDVPGISGNHCILAPFSGGVVLVDVGSTYGSYLPNGTKLVPNQKYPLKAGDMFCLGNKEQIFRIEPIGGAAPKAAPAAPAAYTLAGVGGHFAGRKMALNKPIRIGRAPGCDVLYPTNVPGISGNHCTLTPTAEGVVLVDQGSTYGTYQPNGTKLNPNQKYLLKKGDGFCLGNASQRFTIE